MLIRNGFWKFYFPLSLVSFRCDFRPFFLFLLLFTSFQLQAAGATTARKQIYSRAVAQATTDINRIAKQENWQSPQIKVNVFIPTEAGRFPLCKSELQASRPEGDKIDLNRLRYDIRCEDDAGWETGVTVKPDIYLAILVAKRTLQRGEKVAPNDVELKKHNISSQPNGFITNPDDAVGLTVKKRIRDMQPLTISQLEQPILVDRGQQVIMLAGEGNIEIKTVGESMKKGRKGDVIKVRNLTSGKVVSATVVDLGVVRAL